MYILLIKSKIILLPVHFGQGFNPECKSWNFFHNFGLQSTNLRNNNPNLWNPLGSNTTEPQSTPAPHTSLLSKKPPLFHYLSILLHAKIKNKFLLEFKQLQLSQESHLNFMVFACHCQKQIVPSAPVEVRYRVVPFLAGEN